MQLGGDRVENAGRTEIKLNFALIIYVKNVHVKY